MSTQAYYKDRLGFDPREAMYEGPQEKYRKTGGAADSNKPHGYEENLTKFKGTIWDYFRESTSGMVEGFQF